MCAITAIESFCDKRRNNTVVILRRVINQIRDRDTKKLCDRLYLRRWDIIHAPAFPLAYCILFYAQALPELRLRKPEQRSVIFDFFANRHCRFPFITLYLNNNTKNLKVNKKYLDKVRKMRIMKVS